MKFLISFLKGAIVGIANIIPGVSGGTMMVSMGIYNRLIWSITHLFVKPKKAIRFLLPIFLGALVAIVLLSRIFTYLLEDWSIPTNLGFCGLVVGSTPVIAKEVNFKKRKPIDLICFVLFFFIVILSAVLSVMAFDSQTVLSLNPFELIKLFFVGIIAAATMVVPGVSGSMILMVLGYYQPILNLVNSFMDALKSFNIGGIFYTGLIGAVFALGIAVGVFVIAKIIEILFKRYRNEVYFAILGLILASPIAILLQSNFATFSIFQLVLGLISFGVCFYLSYELSKLKS